MKTLTSQMIPIEDILNAAQRLRGIISPTPLMYNVNLSEQYQANIWLKREDLQVVRSYKIRGAYNKMSSLTEAELANGVVCASAGNHAQRGGLRLPATSSKGHHLYAHPHPQAEDQAGDDVWQNMGEHQAGGRHL